MVSLHSLRRVAKLITDYKKTTHCNYAMLKGENKNGF